MPAIIETRHLADAMSRAIKAVKTRNTIPVLDNVLVTASGGKMTITATDMDTRIETTLPCEGDLDPVTIPARRLYDLARGYPDGSQVKIESDAEQVTVSCGRSRAKLLTLDASQFPAMDEGKMGKAIEADLRSIVDQVKFALSHDEARYYLNGVYLNANSDTLDVVATDGHRLALLRAPLPKNFAGAHIIHRDTLALIPEGVIKFAFSESKIKIKSGDMTITSKLVDGTFPDYDRVIPHALDVSVSFKRSQMLAAIKRLDGLANAVSGKPMRFAVTDGGVTVETKNPQVGVITDEIEADANGEISVGFNTGYMVDFLGAVPSDDVTMEIAESFGVVRDGGITLVQMAQRVA